MNLSGSEHLLSSKSGLVWFAFATTHGSPLRAPHALRTPNSQGPPIPRWPQFYSRVSYSLLNASWRIRGLHPRDPLHVWCCPPGRFKVSEQYTHLRFRTSTPCLTRAIQTSLCMATGDILRDANWGFAGHSTERPSPP